MRPTDLAALRHGSRSSKHCTQNAVEIREALMDANVTARNTDRNDNVWIVFEPLIRLTLVVYVVSVQSRCRASANFGSLTLSRSRAAFQIVHEMTFPPKTQEIERATYTTTFKIPSSELLKYTHKDIRSRTSLFSRPIKEHPKSSLQTFPSQVHLRLQKNRRCSCLDLQQSFEQNWIHELFLKCRQITGTAVPHNL